MSTASQNQNENQEIDLSQVSKKISGLFQSIVNLAFEALHFVKRNIIVLGILFAIGAALGFYLDKKNKIYDSQIIVTPNFNATDYLYSKIDLINSKVNEGDTLFLKNVVGIKNPKKFKKIEIEPITDIYRFIANNPVNFDFIKLLGEDGDLQKIVVDKLTSRNYLYHNISFTTSKLTSDAETVTPILNYLNSSDYFKKVQKEYVNNIKVKIRENDSIITQINGLLNSFSKTANGGQKSSSLVYYNENTQLNEVIKTKDQLIREQGDKRLMLIDTDRIIKDSSHTINIINYKGLNGKLKLVLPLLLIGLFILAIFIRGFYKRQAAKN